jgi:hypothetical protein
MAPEPAPSVDGGDHHRIYRRLALYDFADEIRIGLNLAFYRTFGIPAIGAMLAATGEVAHRARKRADDTGLLMYELIYHGPRHPRGREVIRRLNEIHRGHDIANDDYLYVLATLVVVPTRWVARYGWRPLTVQERHASYLFYRDLGRHMNITGIPDSYERLADFFDNYDRRYLVAHPAGPVLHAATRRLLADKFPRWTRPWALALADALLDTRLRAALGAAEPSAIVRGMARLLLAVRAITARWRRPRTRPAFEPGITTKTYPDGYTIAELGPGRT